MSSNYLKPTRMQLKNHPELNEKWVQNITCLSMKVIQR